jgi:uncharacterized protein YbaR (Trm112 family)
MKPNLIDYLACPSDGAFPLELRPSPYQSQQAAATDGRGEIQQGELFCAACHTAYPIIDGIPCLLPLSKDVSQIQAIPEQTAERLKRDREAPTHEQTLSSYLTRLERKLTLCALSPTPTDIILEVGAGTGRLTRSLSGLCREIVAIDLSLESLKHLRATFAAEEPQQQAPTAIHVVQGNACCLPVRPAKFTKCLSAQTLPCLPGREAQERAVAQLAASLVPGGRAAISAYNWGKPAKYTGRKGRLQKEGTTSDGAFYFKRFEKQEYIDLLSASFQVDSCRGFHTARLDRLRGLGYYLNYLLSSTGFGFRWGIYIMADCIRK